MSDHSLNIVNMVNLTIILLVALKMIVDGLQVQMTFCMTHRLETFFGNNEDKQFHCF